MQAISTGFDKKFVHLICSFRVHIFHDFACADDFEEAVTVLWRELNGKVQELQGLFYAIMSVLNALGHKDSSSFAPYFSTFGDFFERLLEGAINLVKVSPCGTSGVL